MSDIATKLTYLNETKSQLKDMINYGLPTENQITNETTFRNYVSSIFEAFLEALRTPDTLFTNLPKISGNGTQITLNDTANAPMRITLKASELSQDATPTPDSPQDIHTISGNNSVVVEGKNLFDINNEHKVVINPATGTERYGLIVKAPNKKVSISGIWNSGLSLTYRLITNNVAGDYASINSNTTISVIDEIVFYVGSENVKMSSVVSNLQIEISDTPTTYEPYVSQTSPINLPIENLFDISTITENTYINLYGNTGTSSVSNLSDYIEVNSSTQYTLSYTYSSLLNQDVRNIVYYTSNKTVAGGITYSPLNKTNQFTTLNNTKFIRFSYDKNINNIQLEKGTKANSYTPYGTTPIEYCKIGNYEDEFIYNTTDTNLELNKWYLKKNIGKVVLDGSEYWVRNSTYTNAYYVDNYFTDILQNADRTMLSDYFTYGGKMSSSAVVQVGQFYTWSTILNRIILGFDAPDLATFKTWLSSNNVTLYYILATPTYTQITGTLENQLNNIYKNMLSYKGTTNVSQINNDLPFVLGVSALEDLS